MTAPPVAFPRESTSRTVGTSVIRPILCSGIPVALDPAHLGCRVGFSGGGGPLPSIVSRISGGATKQLGTVYDGYDALGQNLFPLLLAIASTTDSLL